MDLLARMETFVRVVDAGSLSAAARQRRVSVAAVSRHVSDLERSVGVSLLARTTRRIRLTDLGQRYYERCQRVLQEVEEAQATVRERMDLPMRISVPVTVGVEAGAQMLAPLLSTHRDLRIDLRLEDRVVDLTLDDVDIAIRVAQMPPLSERVIALPLSAWSRILVAAPSYLRRAGIPSHPAQLPGHALLTSGRDARVTWPLTDAEKTVDVRADARVSTNAGHTLRDLAIGGFGIALVPPWFVAPDLRRRRLVRVLPAWTSAPTQLYLLYRAELRKQRRVKLVVEHLRHAYPAMEQR